MEVTGQMTSKGTCFAHHKTKRQTAINQSHHRMALSKHVGLSTAPPPKSSTTTMSHLISGMRREAMRSNCPWTSLTMASSSTIASRSPRE